MKAKATGKTTAAKTKSSKVSPGKQGRNRSSHLASLFDNISDALISTDMEFHVMEWNPAAESMYGWTAVEVMGHTAGEFIQTEYSEGITREDVIQAVIRQGIWKGEASQNHKDGARFPVMVSISLVKDETGKPIGFVAINRDISSRKQAEAKIERQNQRLSILREIDVAILAADSVEDIVGAALSHIRDLIECRRASLTLIDWGTNEVVIFTISTVDGTPLPPGSRLPLAHFKDVIPTLSQNQPMVFSDLRVLADPTPAIQRLLKDGLCSTCSLPLFSQGSLIGMFSMHSEIPGFFDEEKINLARELANQVAIALTQNRLVEGLRESEEKYHAFFQHSLDAILLTSPDGSVQAANPAACKMFGRTEAELRTLGRSGLVDTNDPRLESLLAERARTGKAHGELTMLRSDGSPFPVELSSALFQDSLGNTRSSMIIRDINERKQAEENLRQSEKKFSDTFRQSPAAMTITRIADGTFVDANEVFLQTFGFTRDEVIGHTSTELNLLDLEARRTLIERQLASGGLRNTELEVRSKSGRIINALFSSSPIEIDQEPHHITTMIDITDRKQAEKDLHESEQKFSTLFKRAPFAAQVTKLPAGEIVEVNEEFEKLVGYPREELIGKTSLELNMYPDPETRARTAAEFQTRGFIRNAELAFRTQFGDLRHLLTSADFIDIGSEKHVLTTAQDITERRLAEEAHRESERRYYNLFNNMREALWIGEAIFDEAGKPIDYIFVDVNPEWIRQAGLSREHIIGKRLRSIQPNVNAKTLDIFETVMLTGEPIQDENHSLDTGGWYQNYVYKLGEKYLCVLSIIITERKLAEFKLARYTEDLKRSNAELEQFAYVSSHDLQEPLRMVSSYVQLLAKRYKGRLDADADVFIGFAVEGAARMQQLINDLLMYSRVGTQDKPFAPTNFDQVLEISLANLRIAVEESGAVITHDPLPTLMADPVQITQLFQNLVGNAIKFRSEAPPRVHIHAEQQGQHWLFSVTDNGIGIDPQFSKRIFVIFQRLHTRSEYEGNGVGLAICQKIVERHGGRIWVEPASGQGSSFYFTIGDSRGKYDDQK